MPRRCFGKTYKQVAETLLVKPLSIAKAFTVKLPSVPGSAERT